MRPAKPSKTNAMRALERGGVAFEAQVYEDDGSLATGYGMHVAEALGEDPDTAFKTLVTVAPSGSHVVCCIPVAHELDLKKAARAAGEKNIEMVKSSELFGLTGYVHGGCSPLGMKKLFPTYIDETCVLFDTVMFSAGRIGAQLIMSYEDLAAAMPIEACDLTVVC